MFFMIIDSHVLLHLFSSMCCHENSALQEEFLEPAFFSAKASVWDMNNTQAVL